MAAATALTDRSQTRGPTLPRYRGWAITALALGVFAAVAATAMPTAALPMLSRELGGSNAESIWIIVLFQVGSAIALLPAAALVEIHGVRPVMLAGLALFTVASFACMECSTLTQLAIARILQGVGSAGVMTVTGALVRQYYPPSQCGRGIGIASFATATAGTVGPVIGVFLSTWASWQAIFVAIAVNGLAAFGIAWPALAGVPRVARTYPLGQALATSCVIGAVLVGLFGMTQPHVSPVYPMLLMGGIVGAVPLVKNQLKMQHPVLPVDLLLLPDLARSYGLSVGFFCAHLMTFALLPFLLIYRLHAYPAQIGLMIAPLSLFAALSAPLAARLAELAPAHKVASTGTALLAFGIFSLVLMPANAGWIGTSWRLAFVGTGFGLFQTPNFKLIVASAPEGRNGSAGGLQAATRLIGQALGSAFVALGLHLTGPASLVTLIAAGLIATVVTIAGLLLPARGHAVLPDAAASEVAS